MKILFVWPNKETLGFKPIGISILSSIALQKGYTVDLFETTFIDLGFKTNIETLEDVFVFKPTDLSSYNIVKKQASLEDEFRSKLNSFNPDIVAFSVLSDEVEVAHRCAKESKRWKPSVINIFGGKYPTISPEDAIAHDFIDFICVSEGLEAFPEWLEALKSGKDLLKIKNIWGKLNNKVVKNPIRPLSKDLDSLPYLYWGHFDKRDFIKPFNGKAYRGGDYMANWGCVYECSYCINKYLHDLHGRNAFVRRYTPERAVSELKYLKEKYQLSFFKFHDEDFLLRDAASFEKFAGLYKKELGLPFVIETNPRSVNKINARLLKEMNCVSASLGVESGNEYIRKNILKRKESREDVLKAFHTLNDVGIRTVAFLMLGLPFDSREAIFDSIELMREARVRVPNLGIFFPFEKTELREVSIKNGFYDPKEVPVYTNNIPALNQKTLTRQDLLNLRKVFNLYVKFPRSFWPLINRAEKNDAAGKEIFSILKEIYIERVRNQEDYFIDN